MEFIPKENHAGIMELKNGSSANYGVIRTINDRGVPLKLIHYTGQGLYEIFYTLLEENKNKFTEEEKNRAQELKKKDIKWLIKNKYIAITPYDNIKRFIS